MHYHFQVIAHELAVSVSQVSATVSLLDGGATVPFISRYRKEATGSLDEVAITTIRDRVTQLRELDKRRETVLKSIEEQGKLTDELKRKIEAAATMNELEDLYLPYKPRRRTRAAMAREKGLEPLAERLFTQENFDLEQEAARFTSAEKEVPDTDVALAGARDIIAEWINEDQAIRQKARKIFGNESVLVSKVITGKEEEGAKYKDYFDWSEPVKNIPSHRLLAMRRGERELVLALDMTPPEDLLLAMLERQVVKGSSPAAQQVKMAAKDALKRLLKPSMETELRMSTKKSADDEAIKVFADNLRQLLLAPPLGEKNVLALDPGFRTGCKAVCLNRQGKLVQNDTIFPNEPQKRTAEAAATIKHLIDTHKIEAVAIGNGTASRETENFVRGLGLPSSIAIIMVNESGASVYSASKVARNEFPDHDVTVRGAVSIGRRLTDPLAELVKIDPKSIGVGQYQHDVDQTALKNGLDDVVISCVNSVGVEVNTASKELLSYVSGLGSSLAGNIVKFREDKGTFTSRHELKNVPRLGEKAFEQAAGFLRIRNAANPLDASAVHPESYPVAEQMASDLNCSVKDLMTRPELREQIKLEKYVTDKTGLPTLQDILSELAKPGRDPRDKFEAFQFAEGVESMKDLKTGMALPGIVTNITNFGAFVDIGVHQDGLVHLSQMADRYIKHPSEVVKVHQKVEVRVMEVDLPRKRIALSMKSEEARPAAGKKGKATAGRKKQPDMNKKLQELKNRFKK